MLRMNAVLPWLNFALPSVALVAALAGGCGTNSANVPDGRSTGNVDAAMVAVDASKSIDARVAQPDAHVAEPDARITAPDAHVAAPDARSLPVDAQPNGIDARSLTIDASGGSADARTAAADAAVDASNNSPLSVTIVDSPSDPTTAINGTFTFLTSGPIATIQCSLNAAAFAPCTSPYDAQFTDGVQTFEVQVADSHGNVASDSHSVTAHLLTWSRIPAQQPPQRFGAGMVYDSQRQRVVFFGGEAQQGGTNETWEWNGESWTQMFPELSPPALFAGNLAALINPALTYDEADQRVLFFGGQDPSDSTIGMTWEWDGTNWTQLTPITSPPYRTSASIVYDQRHHVAILFGGVDGNVEDLNDTWSWDGTNWTQLTPANSPTVRASAAMAYDAVHNDIVLFGGADPSDAVLSDTWQWDGTNWTQLTPATSPSADYLRVKASDTTAQPILVEYEQSQLEVWTWDGSNWSSQLDSNSPTAAELQFDPISSSVAYDEARAQLLLYGFDGDTSTNNLTWTWNSGEGWIQPALLGAPDEIDSSTVAYDPVRNRMVLFALSEGLNGSPYNSQTWEWDGAHWQRMSSTTAPSPRFNASIAYDPNSAGTILFGGSATADGSLLNDTWLWDGNDWTQLQPSTSPSGRKFPALAARGSSGLVLFGGVTGITSGFPPRPIFASDTWTWDGTTWNQANPSTSPSARASSTLAYDSHHDRLVLFGGNGASSISDTWTWDGENWNQQTSTLTPSANAGPSMTYDVNLDQVVLFDGSQGDVQTWDGSSWNARSTLPRPPAQASPLLVYAADAGECDLFSDDTNNKDMWIVNSPLVTLTTTPAAHTNAATPSVEFTTVDSPSSVDCQIDDGEFVGCSSPFTSSTLADGAHSITVRVVDPSGDPGKATATFVVDTTAPGVAITPSYSINNPQFDPTGPTFTFSITGAPTTVRCHTDSNSSVPCGSPFTTSVPGFGPHSFEVDATDAAGNTNSQVFDFNL